MKPVSMRGITPAARWALAVAAACFTAAPSLAWGEGVDPARNRFLLLDSRLIEKVENARLAVGTVNKHPGNPLFGQELPWETNTSHMYPNVVYDPHERIYKLWYYTRMDDAGVLEWKRDVTPGPLAPKQTGEGNCATLYATSKDGIRWEKPALDVYRYKGKPTNIVVWRDHGTGVFLDARDPDPMRRYKLITVRGAPGKIDAAFSPDGIRWSEFRCIAEARGDTHNNAFWAPSLDRYVAITRAYPGMRTVLRMESEDFINWTEPVEVLRGSQAAQTYSMPVFPYAGVYLGLPAIFRAGTDKRVHTELAWSPDTAAWKRIQPGAQLIPLSEKAGALDRGCIYAAAVPVVLEDEIRIYYSAQKKQHSDQPGWLCMATMRSDGWAGYEQEVVKQPAVVTTTAIPYKGQPLGITADVAKGGSVRVCVVDDNGQHVARAAPVSQTVSDERLVWDKQIEPGTIRLRFEFSNAKLFSFSMGD